MSTSSERYREQAAASVAEMRAINAFLDEQNSTLWAAWIKVQDALCSAMDDIDKRVSYLPPPHYPSPEVTHHLDERSYTPVRHYVLTHFVREGGQIMCGDCFNGSLIAAPKSAKPLLEAFEASDLAPYDVWQWHGALVNAGSKEGIGENNRSQLTNSHTTLQKAKKGLEAIIEAYTIDNTIIRQETAQKAQAALDLLNEQIIPVFGEDKNTEMVDRMLKFNSRAEVVKRQMNPAFDEVAKAAEQEKVPAMPTQSNRTPADIVAAGSQPPWSRGRKSSPNGEGIC